MWGGPMRALEAIRGIVVPLLLCLSLAVILGWLLPLGLLFLAAIIAAATFQIYILVKSVGSYWIPLDSATTTNYLMMELNRRYLRVVSSPEGFKLNLTTISGLKIKIRPVNGGTKVVIKAEPTTDGWILIIVFVIFHMTSILIFPLAIQLYLKANKFTREVIEPILSFPPSDVEIHVEEDVNLILLQSLAEGHRIAAEAFEAQRSYYQDVLLIAVIFWLICGSSLMVLAADSSFPSVVIMGSLLLASILMIPFILYAWFWVRPLTYEYKAWTEGLWERWQRETTGQMVSSGCLEYLLDACMEMPKWIEARWGASHYREPGIWSTIAIIIYFASLLALGLFPIDPYVSTEFWWVKYLLSSLLFGASIILFLRWRRAMSVARNRTRALWNKRKSIIESEIESLLTGGTA